MTPTPPPSQPAVPPPPAASGPWRTHAPVVVVGGGLAAMSTAWYLALQGIHPVVLVPRADPLDASTRGLGLLMPGLGEDPARLARAVGQEAMADIYRFGQAAIALVGGLGGEIDADWRPTSALMLARGAGEAADLEASIPLLLEAGLTVEAVGAEEAARVGRGFLGGLRFLRAGLIDPAKLNLALAGAAAREGAHFQWEVPVTDVDESPAGVTLRTSSGEVTAELVVVADGPTGSAICPSLKETLFPARVQHLGTAPIAGGPLEPGSSSSGFDFWRRGPAGELLLGGARYLSGELGLRQPHDVFDPRVSSRQDAFAAGLAGGAAPSITHRWNRRIDVSCDGLPLVGPVPGRSRLLLLTGFAGYDSTYGLLCARSVVERILELPVGQPIPGLFSPRRMV